MDTSVEISRYWLLWEGVCPLSVMRWEGWPSPSKDLRNSGEAVTVFDCVLCFTSWLDYTYGQISNTANNAVLLKAISPLQSLRETVNTQRLGTDWTVGELWENFFSFFIEFRTCFSCTLSQRWDKPLFFFFTEKKNKNCHLTVAVHIWQTREKSKFKEGKKKGKLQSGEGPPCKSVPSAQCGPLLRACTSNTMATAAISIIYLLFFLLGGSHYVAEKPYFVLKSGALPHGIVCFCSVRADGEWEGKYLADGATF